MKRTLLLAVIVSFLSFPQFALSAWPLGEPQVDIRKNGQNINLTTRYTKQSDRAYFKIFVQRGDDIYVVWRSFKNDHQVTSRRLNAEEAAYVRENLSQYIFPANSQFTITTPSGTISLSQRGDRWIERPVGGSSSSGGSTSSSGADEEPQDDDPVSSSGGSCQGKACVPICQLTGTCGSSSGGSGSSSGGSGSSSGGSSGSSSGSSGSSSSGSGSTSGSSSSSGGSSGSASCPSFKNDLFLNPFNKNSAHHRPIGTGAVYGGTDHPITQALTRARFGSLNAGIPWGKALYKSASTDPVKTVVWNRVESGRNLPVSLRVPRDVTAGIPDSDGVISIYDPVSDIATSLRRWAWNNGSPSASIVFQNPLRGLGHPRAGEGRIGPSASGMSEVLGILRGHEVNTPGVKIAHVTQMSMDRFGNNALLKNAFVWPAISTDSSCGEGRKEDGVLDCSGPIPYGQLLAIPRDINLVSLGLSEPGLRLAQAWQQYGVRTTDGTVSNGAANVRGDQHISPTVRSQLLNDMRNKLFHMLRPVLNDASDQEASGGGIPLGPNCAFDAPASGSSGGGGTSSSSSTSSSSGASSSGGVVRSFAPRSVLHPKGITGENGGGGLIENIQLPPADQYYLDYTVKFRSPFDWHGDPRGGKLPGLAGGKGTGGCRDIEPDGWSARQVWHKGGEGHLYLYHQDRKTGCGDKTIWKNPDGSTFKFQQDRIYRITQRVKVNTPDQPNGEDQVWVDGVQVAYRNNIRFRGAVDPSVARVSMLKYHSYFGGKAPFAPDYDSYIDYGNLYVMSCAPDFARAAGTCK